MKAPVRELTNRFLSPIHAAPKLAISSDQRMNKMSDFTELFASCDTVQRTLYKSACAARAVSALSACTGDAHSPESKVTVRAEGVVRVRQVSGRVLCLLAGGGTVRHMTWIPCCLPGPCGDPARSAPG